MEALLKIEAVLIDILQPNWAEFELLIRLKEFVILTFQPSIEKEKLKRFEVLANTIASLCQDLRPGFEIFCKLHHLTHYGDLVEFYGPLFLYSTFR